MENHKYISLEIDGYNPNLYRMTYKVPGDYHIREIYIDMSGNIQDEIPYDMPWDVQEELNEFVDSLRNTDDVYVDVFEKEFEEFKKQKKTASKNLITIFLIYIINFLWHSIPYFIVLENLKILPLLYPVYYFLFKIYPRTVFWFAIIHFVLTVIGTYIAFTQFPLVFGLIYLVYAITYCFDFLRKLFIGLRR